MDNIGRVDEVKGAKDVVNYYFDMAFVKVYASLLFQQLVKVRLLAFNHKEYVVKLRQIDH